MKWSKENNRKNKHIILLAIIITLGLYLAFGLFHLEKFDTADEHFWIGDGRMAQYWNAIHEKKWKATRINDKPGITLAYISGVGMNFDSSYHNGSFEKQENFFPRNDTDKFQKTIFFYRLPILIFNGLFSLFFFWIIFRLTGNVWIGLWTMILIILSPIILGISQIVNPDALSWTFSSAALFSFLLLLKERSKKIILLAGLLLGLALATKYIALILFYFFFFAWLAYIVFKYDSRDNDQEKALPREILRLSASYLAVIAVSLLVFSLLMPAVFVKSKYLFHDVIAFSHTGWIFWSMMVLDSLILLDSLTLKNRILLSVLKPIAVHKRKFFLAVVTMMSGVFLFTLINWALGINLFNLEEVPFDSRQSDFFNSLPVWQKFLLQARPLAFSLTPIALFMLLFVWLKSIWAKTRYDFYIFALTVFILMYWIVVVYQELLTNIRYGIILQPAVLFLSAIGIGELAGIRNIPRVFRPAATLAVILLSVLSLWMIKPFYFNYTNALLPKNNLIAGAWGYGGYEAAQFLNNLPDARNNFVIADYPGTCPFTISRCTDISNDNRKEVIEFLNKNESNVYFVFTRRGQMRWGYIGQFIAAKKKAPLWELVIGGRPGNFIKVYRQEAGNN